MANNKQQYIYVLKLIPELLEKNNWTEKENEIVEKHFKVLKKLKKDGRLILAGRTLNMDENCFGIVILSVDKEDEAKLLMENDPAVKEGIMTAQLYPYKVALISEENLQ